MGDLCVSGHRWDFPVVEIVSVYDGDTMTVWLDLGFNIRQRHTVRLAHVDTPELRGGTESMKRFAKFARDEVRRWLNGTFMGGILVCRSVDQRDGKYGRLIGDFIGADGRALSDYLIERRLGVAYEGASRDAIQVTHGENADHHGFTEDD